MVPATSGGEIQARLFFLPPPYATSQQPGEPTLREVAQNTGGRIALLVHQYSVMGGSQDLMKGMARILAARYRVAACTFNLRGVGKSSGSSTITGQSEVQDVVDIGQWISNLGFDKILLLCSSAGAPIGGSAIDLVPAVKGYVGIGYVFGFWASILFKGHYKAFFDSKKPKFLIQGDRDEFTGKDTLINWAVKQSQSEVTETKIYPGLGHFELEGPAYDSEMADVAADFAQRHNIWDLGNSPSTPAASPS